MSDDGKMVVTTLRLPAKDYQDLQRAQNGGFSGDDLFWKKQSGDDGFVTWALRAVFYLMKQDEFYPLLEKVKADLAEKDKEDK